MIMYWWHLINYRFKNKKNITTSYQEIPQYHEDFKRLDFNKLSYDDQVSLRNSYVATLHIFMHRPTFYKLILCNLKKNKIPEDALPLRPALQNVYDKQEGDILSPRQINFCIHLVLLKYLECSFKMAYLIEVYFTSNYDMYIKTPKSLNDSSIKTINRMGFDIKRCEPFNNTKL